MIVRHLVAIGISPDPEFERVIRRQVEFSRLELAGEPWPADRILATFTAVMQVIYDDRPTQSGVAFVPRRFRNFRLALSSSVFPIGEIVGQIEPYQRSCSS